MSQTYLDQSTKVHVVDPIFRTIVKPESLNDIPQYLLEEELDTDRVFVVTDTNVDKHYGDIVRTVLNGAGIETVVITIPAGEESKTWETAGRVDAELSEHNATRATPLIALGGGVIGDLAGFVASVYNRGIPLVHVPTTLLAMVDSSIGGKTGVDHGGKNKTGSFYQPKLVVADPTVLNTLEQTVYTEGFGEVVKYAMLDASFTPELEEAADDLREYSDENVDLLSKIIARCVKQKSDIIMNDPNEQSLDGRILLNYGHTLAHGLEAGGNYTELLHGEAVSIGMNFAAEFALALGIAEQDLVSRQTELLKSLGLPLSYRGIANAGEIMKHIIKDKKNLSSDETRFVLPQQIGQMQVLKIGNQTVKAAVEEFLTSS